MRNDRAVPFEVLGNVCFTFLFKIIFRYFCNGFLDEKFNLMIFGGSAENTNKVLNDHILQSMKPIMENWSKTELSNEIIVYGVRRYLRGAWLSLHVDRPDTHVLSAILQESI